MGIQLTSVPFSDDDPSIEVSRHQSIADLQADHSRRPRLASTSIASSETRLCLVRPSPSRSFCRARSASRGRRKWRTFSLQHSRLWLPAPIGSATNDADAERYGLVNYVTRPGEALAHAKALALRIATNAPMSNFAVTNALPRIQDLSHEDGLFFESLMAALTQTSPEAEECLKAFLSKRAGRVSPPE